MNPVSIAEAAAKLPNLIDAALRGEDVTIVTSDRLWVKLTPTNPVKNRQPGSAKGQVWMSDDFDEPLEDFKDYM